MSIFSIVIIYLMATLVFFAVDIAWLGFIARDFYRNKLGNVVDVNIHWPAAIVFYLIYIAGILIFAILPALKTGSLQTAIVWGALFGFFTYATYDLTNMATIRKWPLKVVVVDMIWGTILSATVAGVTFWVGSRLVKSGLL